jgi:hypothetical protein
LKGEVVQNKFKTTSKMSQMKKRMAGKVIEGGVSKEGMGSVSEEKPQQSGNKEEDGAIYKQTVN